MFRPGDKIKCVDSQASRFLRVGRTYTVLRMSDLGTLQILEAMEKHPGHGYSPVQFKLIGTRKIIRKKAAWKVPRVSAR